MIVCVLIYIVSAVLASFLFCSNVTQKVDSFIEYIYLVWWYQNLHTQNSPLQKFLLWI